MQFSILVKKYDIFEKPPQLNFSQASWLVSMDSHKVINNVSTDKSEWCVTVDRNICWIRYTVLATDKTSKPPITVENLGFSFSFDYHNSRNYCGCCEINFLGRQEVFVVLLIIFLCLKIVALK